MEQSFGFFMLFLLDLLGEWVPYYPLPLLKASVQSHFFLFFCCFLSPLLLITLLVLSFTVETATHSMLLLWNTQGIEPRHPLFTELSSFGSYPYDPALSRTPVNSHGQAASVQLLLPWTLVTFH